VGSASFQFAFAVNGYSWDIPDWHIDDIQLTGMPLTGTLQGVVKNCFNNSLLDGVTVIAGDYSTNTNTSGFYQFIGLPVGTYDVEFSGNDYITKTVHGVHVLDASTTTLDTCLNHVSPPANATIQNTTVASGQTLCFDATQIITVAGSGTTFIVQNGGNVTMIAGQKIRYLPGAWAKAGGYMHGKIAPSGPYCQSPSAPVVASFTGEEENNPASTVQSSIRVYPNPTNGRFRIELTGKSQTVPLQVEIYGMRGEKVLSESVPGEKFHEFSLAGRSPGIYFIKVIDGADILTAKLVITR
jgi:hypothetical protein